MLVFNALKNLLTQNFTPQLPGTPSTPSAAPGNLTPFMNQAMANYAQQARPVQNLGFGVQPQLQPSVAQVLFAPQQPIQQPIQQVTPQPPLQVQQPVSTQPISPVETRKTIPRINYPERFGDWGARFKQLEK